jgi:CRISPR/Cas system CMR-associated protein Cmr1 (group 7 of RAMP superfamily)
MYKLTFTLKQHTPLIHFQHDQAGATLRATEVKPKLDFFIMKKLLNDPDIPDHKIRDEFYEKAMTKLPDGNDNPWKNWLVGKGKNEHVALDYKLVIQPVEEEWIEKFIIASLIPKPKVFDYEREGKKVLDRTPYFADNKPLKEGKINEAKLGLMLKEGKELKLIFRYIDLDFEKLLNEALPLFFVSTNFGSRQSKGFGCFLPSNISQRELENLLRICFPIAFRSKQFRDLKDVFSGIDSIYKNLKSGDRNTESELRKYFNSFRPVIEWEKPKIQERVAEISRMNLRINSETNNRQFVRAVLGLPEIFEYPDPWKVKAQVNFDKSQVKNDYEVIDRYGSPILFKVFDKTVYLNGNQKENSEVMLNKTFEFEFTQQGRNCGEIKGMKTPKEFNLVEFLEVAMTNKISWVRI